MSSKLEPVFSDDSVVIRIVSQLLIATWKVGDLYAIVIDHLGGFGTGSSSHHNLHVGYIL